MRVSAPDRALAHLQNSSICRCIRSSHQSRLFHSKSEFCAAQPRPSLLRIICNPQTGNSKRENGPVNEKIDTNAISAAETNRFFDGLMSKIANAPIGKIHWLLASVAIVPSSVRNVMQARRLPARAVRDRDALDLRHAPEPAARRPGRRARWSCASAPAASAAPRPRRASPARSPTAGTSAPSRPPTSGPSAASSTAARRSTGGPREELARELAQRLRPRVAGAPEGIGSEEFLERLSAAED